MYFFIGCQIYGLLKLWVPSFLSVQNLSNAVFVRLIGCQRKFVSFKVNDGNFGQHLDVLNFYRFNWAENINLTATARWRNINSIMIPSRKLLYNFDIQKYKFQFKYLIYFKHKKSLPIYQDGSFACDLFCSFYPLFLKLALW